MATTVKKATIGELIAKLDATTQAATQSRVGALTALQAAKASKDELVQVAAEIDDAMAEIRAYVAEELSEPVATPAPVVPMAPLAPPVDPHATGTGTGIAATQKKSLWDKIWN